MFAGVRCGNAMQGCKQMGDACTGTQWCEMLCQQTGGPRCEIKSRRVTVMLAQRLDALRREAESGAVLAVGRVGRVRLAKILALRTT